MYTLIGLTILFGIFSAASIVFTGDRGLISGNLRGSNFIHLILDKRFIFAMILAVASRFTFIFINNTLLQMPEFAKNSTTITSFITAISYIFIIVANYLFLHERLTVTQIIGAGLVMVGIAIMVK